jgi:glycosyltransferase involved in cell wall biosynthesis
LVDTIVGYEADGTPKRVRRSILEEVHDYAERASAIALAEEFHLIHAHDWTAYLAGVKAKRATGKPLILHVHATSFDQAASHNVDPSIFAIEQEAFKVADEIITVSQYTKDILVHYHKVPAGKISVVHNGCDTFDPPRYEPALQALRAQGKRIVLYHGRITIQKGVDYFVRAARRVVDYDPNVIFVISGWGDMTNQILEQVGQAGLTGHVIFAGALWDEERDRMYQTADLVVMPSVSEPFGLVPLEAIQHGTPSLISKQSGVKEVLTHVLKVDFWDVDEMANQIIATLRYEPMRRQLITEGRQEINRLSWQSVARRVRQLYDRLIQLAYS